jgi:hypothetical protein
MFYQSLDNLVIVVLIKNDSADFSTMFISFDNVTFCQINTDVPWFFSSLKLLDKLFC